MWKHDNLIIIHMGKKIAVWKHTLEVVGHIDGVVSRVKSGKYHISQYDIGCVIQLVRRH